MEERNERGETLQEFLDNYDETLYRRPSNTVDIVLMTVSENKLKVLLVKRKDYPFIHDWAMPGGFINFDEDIETAVTRELAEETSISSDNYFTQLYTFGNANRDPRTRIITTVYLSMTPETNIKNTKAADDAADTGWFTIRKKIVSSDEKCRKSVLSLDEESKGVHMEYFVNDIACSNYVDTKSQILDSSNAKLAADHVKAINMAMDQMQHRVASSGILFNLLPAEFTLREVQNAYEAVTDHKVDTANFRRDIRKMLVSVGKKKKTTGKMAELFRFNPMYTFLEEDL